MIKKTRMKRIQYRAENIDDISPYKNLLGAIINQAIKDAVGLKLYRGLYYKVKQYPEKYGYGRRREIKERYRMMLVAHRFIIGAGIEEFLNFWKVDLNVGYFRKKFLEIEREAYRCGNPVNYLKNF